MSPEVEEKLISKYPELYRYKIKIFCEDGWYWILDDLSEKLEPLGVIAEQVKEKFGGLRFYYTINTDDESVWHKVAQLVGEAEDISYHVCEICGESGELRLNGYWYKTLCDKHYNEWLLK